MHIKDQASTAYPRKVIEAMNQENGDLVLAVGDMASKPTRAELELAKGVLDHSKAPYYPVVGNHDSPRYGVEETMFLEVFSLKESSYSFVHRGILFLGIDHGCGPRYKKNAVRPKHMAFIKETLANTPVDQPIVFFSHYPFARGVSYRTKNADEVQALFVGRPLLAMISGHWHGNTEKIENGILMTTTACSSSTRGNHDGTKPKGYRVFTIHPDRTVSTEFKEVKA